MAPSHVEVEWMLSTLEKEDLTKYIITVKPEGQCGICQRYFMEKSNLVIHMIKIHHEPTEDSKPKIHIKKVGY